MKSGLMLNSIKAMMNQVGALRIPYPRAFKGILKGSGLNKLDGLSLNVQTMVVCIDVAHRFPRAARCSYRCRHVAAIDGKYGQWASQCALPGSLTQMASKFEDKLVQQLRVQQKDNVQVLSRLLLCHDRASEDQYQEALDAESPAFDRAIRGLTP